MNCIFVISLSPVVNINIQGMEIDTSLLENVIQEYFNSRKFSFEEKIQIAYDCVESFVKEYNKNLNDHILKESNCTIPIYNPDDKIEVIVKNEFAIGQICKSKKEIFETIGIENLGIKNLNGGKQKRIANDTVSQYLSMQPVNGKKQMQQITDIFEIPHILDEIDNRGRSGFYLDRGIPIVLNYFQKKGENEICTSVDNLSRVIGLVGDKFKRLSSDELLEYNNKFTQAMVSQFYYRCKPEQEAVVFRILDRLQNDYSVISYYKNFNIKHFDGSVHVSTVEEDILIRRTQKRVLNEFNAKKLMTIYRRKQEKEFYKRVCQLINEEKKTNWISYYNQVQIFVDIEGLKDISEDFCMDLLNLKQSKDEIMQRFHDRIIHITEKDIRLQNEQNRKAIDNWLESDNLPESVKEIKDFMSLGLLKDDETYKQLAMSKNLFVYHDSYKYIQSDLIDLLLSPPNQKGTF